MKRPHDRKTTIDPAHAQGESKAPHNREQLRRRLLKMILQNEAQRRSLHTVVRDLPEAAAKLAVFDPDDFIGRELAVSPTPQKPA